MSSQNREGPLRVLGVMANEPLCCLVPSIVPAKKGPVGEAVRVWCVHFPPSELRHLTYDNQSCIAGRAGTRPSCALPQDARSSANQT